MDFQNLTLLETRAETPELTHLKLQGGAGGFHQAHSAPGQYVQIKHGDLKPGFFAIANAPDGKCVELLVKRGTPLADAICSKAAGDVLAASMPQGKGYALSHAHGRDVLVVGVGSGIAPLRSLMQTLLMDKASYGRITFVYGARCVAGFPYMAEMDEWRRRGADVVCVCSQPGGDAWNGPVGRVHHAILSRHQKLPSDTAVFACGMKSMVEDLKNACAQLGVGADRVLQNF
jgi:NAD(P)H-flavin reductase